MPPPTKAPPPHKMIFTKNSLRNTTIAVEDDQFFYEIVTRFWHPYTTKIKKLDPDTNTIKTIAELEKLPGEEAKLRFVDKDGEGESVPWIKASDWMKIEETKAGGVFTGNTDVQYRWKTHKRQLQMIRAEGEDKAPVAVHYKHKRHFWVFRMSKHAYLEVQPELTDSLDKLIMSYLIVERRRRDMGLRVYTKAN